MKRCLQIALSLAALAMLTGCGGPVGRKQAAQLSSWLEQQSYSTWSTFRQRHATPERPASPDGLTLGSPNVFAAIGCNPDDLSEISVLWGDRRTTRALGKPITVSAKTGLLSSAPLAEFSSQTLQRVRHTSISVFAAEEKGLSIRAVDFAPMGQNDNFLARWFLVENGDRIAHRVTLSLELAAAGEWKRTSRHSYQCGEKLAVVSDQKISVKDNTLTLPLGNLKPGRQAAAALFLIVAKDQAALDRGVKRVEETRCQPLILLEETRKNWEQWCRATPLETGEERVDDLLDSLLCLVRSHLGPEAIHTGSVRYPHDRAWVRDSYWVQRALLELGLVKEARLNLDFFHRAYTKSGIASSYQIPDGKPMSWGYSRVELPHYLVLMVRDAEELGRVDPDQYWDMVRGCLDNAAVFPDGEQPMNGDETWILAAPVRELDDLLDNSWLLIASAEYGSKLALRQHDPARAANYGALAYRARMALRKFMPSHWQPDWYAVGRGGDGSLDFSLCPEVFARGHLLGVLPATDGLITSGLSASWERLNFDRGIRTHSRSATISGGTPGYVLYTAADNPGLASQFSRELRDRMTEFASATGCVWEYHDLHDPAWGGEKRRLWDSAVLLLGMAHASFDIQHRDRTYFLERREPAPLIEALTDLPDFDVAEFLRAAGPTLLYEQQSPEHAARLARELTRHLNRPFAVAPYTYEPPFDASALIISVGDPPGVWLQTSLGYYVRAWGGPPQLWVRNRGDVFRDTDPVLTDLLSYLPPAREQPNPFPDANYELAARLGEAPSGTARLTALSDGRSAERNLDLAGDRAEIALGADRLRVEAFADKPGTLKLALRATRPAAAELSLTLPSGWWLVYARDMTGKWDRVADPVREERLPDGRTRLNYSLRAAKEPLHLAFDLARPRVKREPAPPLPTPEPRDEQLDQLAPEGDSP